MTDEQSSAPMSFWADQERRLAVRWIVMRYALISLAFWGAAILLVAWLRQVELVPVAVLFAVVWLYFALRTLLVHSQFIVDVASYVLSGRTYFFPELLRYVEEPAARDRALASLSPTARSLYERLFPYFRAASFTSPLAGIATWALVVLVRMPRAVHEPRLAPRAEMQQTIRVGRAIELAVTERYAGRQFRFAA